jgi:hypothetical protein
MLKIRRHGKIRRISRGVDYRPEIRQITPNIERPFTTEALINKMERKDEIVGGKGCGVYRSEYKDIADAIKKCGFTRIDYVSASKNWGSPVVALWG